MCVCFGMLHKWACFLFLMKKEWLIFQVPTHPDGDMMSTAMMQSGIQSHTNGNGVEAGLYQNNIPAPGTNVIRLDPLCICMNIIC